MARRSIIRNRRRTVDEDEALILAAREDVEAFGRLYDKYYCDMNRGGTGMILLAN